MDANDVQPVIQVFAKGAGADLLYQVPVGGRDDSDVHMSGRPLGADALHLSGLKEPQEHALHARAHLARFVQERGTPIRDLQQARLVTKRTGKAAADVTEELGFEQRVGQPGTVDRESGAWLRALLLWMSRATTSLPTPVSPVMSTLASDRAAISISWLSCMLMRLEPTKHTS